MQYTINSEVKQFILFCLVQCQIKRPKATPTILVTFSKFPQNIAWPYSGIIGSEDAEIAEVASPPEAWKSHQALLKGM